MNSDVLHDRRRRERTAEEETFFRRFAEIERRLANGDAFEEPEDQLVFGELFDALNAHLSRSLARSDDETEQWREFHAAFERRSKELDLKNAEIDARLAALVG